MFFSRKIRSLLLTPKRRWSLILTLCLIFTGINFSTSNDVQASRIKDIAQLHGVRSNQLIGYGLITGLNGTGDDMKKSAFTLQAIYNMMTRSGITLNPSEMKSIKIKNVAAVMVTASLPPFASSGSKIDIQVSSMGDAKSLAGGTLLMTPLKGVDNRVYAIAQGPLAIGAFSFGGKSAQAQKNHPNAGRIPDGATVEDTVLVDIGADGTLTYQLANADFTTANNMTRAINKKFGKDTAYPLDSGSVTINIPPHFSKRVVQFVANVESIDITADSVARVVVNERTGTVVMGQNVRLSTVAVSHGNLNLIIRESFDVSQPAPLADGETVITPSTEISVTEEEGQLVVLNMKNDVSIGEIANALNAIGATPRDLIAIFQAIKAAGAMHGELIVL
ncbi:flagellar basal body P-ring protein FlgI [Desulfotalea psychrophila]|uniref:Flagellar P-ring protein n=1 Tax=Desulfotalea psychrophila (strain LSv54 / DSM 12343) TaxID=177439 RepID=FLGI_DESPS|nr:flagellar basal body P-ring protein FlgI [Desulfotalea psychrophila]Q6AJR7.1 RecName: Full=Flagellar P-ring protein; AltName: Full=Basal body P-ring protein; Flags: Precursor [Desulfotalea psychrophila LSv54]CAG37413.1 probable flagellar P-ring protein (FlgI) [Desulfotalea psychrophila LSv54]